MSRVVVFKSPQDLYELRTLFYGNYEAQRRGISLCKAYEVRGPLPPSVHSTCLLISAIHSDVPVCDLYVTRQAYAMALIRFVNETLDAAQVGRSVIPLHSLAVEARLPNAFVELRHAATHEHLPSIYLLREMANRALDWLHTEFWVHQISQTTSRLATPAQAKANNASNADAEDKIKNLFREWRRIKRSATNATEIPEELAQNLAREWQTNEPEFLNVVLNRNILVPAGTGSVKNRSAVIAMWLPVFLRLGSFFCRKLEDRILTHLSLREWPPSVSENRKFAVLELWAEKLAEYLSEESVDLLGSSPRPWNAQILAKYAASVNDPEIYETAAEMAEITGATLNYTYTAPTKHTVGWKTVPSWKPRPLGVP